MLGLFFSVFFVGEKFTLSIPIGVRCESGPDDCRGGVDFTYFDAIGHVDFGMQWKGSSEKAIDRDERN